MRILDSKDEGDKAINAEAPSLAEHLNETSRDFFAAVREGLAAAGISAEIDPALVRGLDYYTHTAFEFVTAHIGAQGTVLGGGRYDGLIAELGGPPTAGIGWAGGIERLMMLCNEPAPPARPVVLVPLGASAEAKALGIGRALRAARIAVEQDYRGTMKRRMQRANRLNARAAVILGDDELAKGVVQLKDLDSGEQRELAIGALVEALKGWL
jgi:histidyl-tRNA synthetase